MVIHSAQKRLPQQGVRCVSSLRQDYFRSWPSIIYYIAMNEGDRHTIAQWFQRQFDPNRVMFLPPQARGTKMECRTFQKLVAPAHTKIKVDSPLVRSS